MATRANAVAEDGGGEHSPYAQALLDELQTPGLELGLFFRRVRDRVRTATKAARSLTCSAPSGPSRSTSTRSRRTVRRWCAAAAPLTVADNAGPTALGIPAPSDPDDDQLVVQVSAPAAGRDRAGRATGRC